MTERANRRYYPAGDKTALIVTAEGRCQAPECPEPLFKTIEGHRVNNFDFAHIRAIDEGGPRYADGPPMTEAQRNSFDNILLLCSAHHRLIDTIAPNDYPVSVLREWKRKRHVPEVASSGHAMTEDEYTAALDKALQRQTNQLLSAIQRLKVIDPEAAQAVETALEAAEQLSHLPSTSDALLQAADLLVHINSGQLLEAAELLSNAVDRMPES